MAVVQVVTGTGTTAPEATLTATAGNYLCVMVLMETGGADINATITTQSGSTSSWTAMTAADQNNNTDFYSQSGSWATVSSTGSTTIRGASTATNSHIIVVELDSVSGFDTGAYQRITTIGTDQSVGPSVTPASAPARRVGFALDWTGSSNAAPTVGTGWTDHGASWPYGGGPNVVRVVSFAETSVVADQMQLTDTSGSIWHLTQFAFTEVDPATLEQEGFRFGIDDDSESAHTWSQAQDTDDTTALDTTRLLRVLVNATDDPPSTAYTLRYQKNGSGGYVAVPVGASPTITVNASVGLGTDDAQQIGTTMTTTGVTIGASLDATTEYVGLRFQSIAIPQGATITNAYLRVVPSGTAEDEPLVTIAGFDEDNTATFSTTASNITNRTITTATVAWSNTNLSATGTSYHNSPALTTIVQEIVDRGGWASGNAMGFRIQGGATSTRNSTSSPPPTLRQAVKRPRHGSQLPVARPRATSLPAGAGTTRTAPTASTLLPMTTRKWNGRCGSGLQLSITTITIFACTQVKTR